MAARFFQMKEIRCTLLTDGSSDKALLPIISWLFREHCPDFAVQKAWADLYRLPKGTVKTLPDRIRFSIELYPCDVLFIHRDAEKMELEERIAEIQTALQDTEHPPTVCVVPVRMTEAWLLHDEPAIRQAASNPNGRQPLSLPKMSSVENLPDPKQTLYDLLRTASGPISRRRNFDPGRMAHRVADRISTFEPLRQLSAFSRFERELVAAAKEQRWTMS
ncbi:hypothetical protein [Candidatus Electronema sp. JC]|uniref:hypothetical protein n=1 Tax=Candidatus Electronema sp. JC TaxID=3401570 RepID=UPI003B434568